MAPRLVVAAGVVATGLLHRVGENAKAIVAVAILATGAFGVGTYVALRYAEQREYPARLDRLEAGQGRLEASQEEMQQAIVGMAGLLAAVKVSHDSMSARIGPLEGRVTDIQGRQTAIGDRVERVICILMGNRGPSCI